MTDTSHTHPPVRNGQGLRQAVADDVADQLRIQIITGQLAPSANLREAELALRFAVSRGPVREALKTLEREGLIVSRRNCGSAVAVLSDADIDEIFELRLALEMLAVRHAARNRTRDDLAAMAAVLDELADLGAAAHPIKLAELDVAFHHVI